MSGGGFDLMFCASELTEKTKLLLLLVEGLNFLQGSPTNLLCSGAGWCGGVRCDACSSSENQRM